MTLRSEYAVSVIRQHIDELQKQPWIDRARQWWPICLFHCTDITNVVSILRQGEIVSRNWITGTGQLPVDIASPEVIAGTDSRWQEYVRLYFRPKTPTQYNNEGFRPVGQRALNSHCPVPVYLVFDALAVLSRTDSCFSDGNLGSANANVYEDVSFLKQIPFDLVYHDTWFDRSDRDQVIHHRNAEVLVPQRMGLENLRYIGCRSDAEYKTLLHLLPPQTRSRWVDRLGVRPNSQLFNRKWTFVEEVDMNTAKIVFRFNRNSYTPGPFDAHFEIETTATGMKYHWRNEEYQCDQPLEVSLSNIGSPSDYTFRLCLDGQLAHANRYQEGDDLPF